MGRRTGTRTTVEVLCAFVRRPEWRQAALAREVGVGTAALRSCLAELSTSGLIPLQSSFEHPDVVWRLPRGWHPAGVPLDGETVARCIRQLARSPRTSERDAVLARLLRLDPRLSVSPREDAGAWSAEEEDAIQTIEDALRTKRSLRMRYFTASTGAESWRLVSVARLSLSPVPRFVAMCHRRSELRTFRVGNVMASMVDAGEPFRPVDDAVLAAYERGMVNGFRDDHASTGEELAFVVRTPDARWVKRNLPNGVWAEELPGGDLRVRADGVALLPVARFVVGLGDAVTAESPELAKAVRRIAMGALRLRPTELARAKLNERPVPLISSRE